MKNNKENKKIIINQVDSSKTIIILQGTRIVSQLLTIFGCMFLFFGIITVVIFLIRSNTDIFGDDLPPDNPALLTICFITGIIILFCRYSIFPKKILQLTKEKIILDKTCFNYKKKQEEIPIQEFKDVEKILMNTSTDDDDPLYSVTIAGKSTQFHLGQYYLEKEALLLEETIKNFISKT